MPNHLSKIATSNNPPRNRHDAVLSGALKNIHFYKQRADRSQDVENRRHFLDLILHETRKPEVLDAERESTRLDLKAQLDLWKGQAHLQTVDLPAEFPIDTDLTQHAKEILDRDNLRSPGWRRTNLEAARRAFLSSAIKNPGLVDPAIGVSIVDARLARLHQDSTTKAGFFLESIVASSNATYQPQRNTVPGTNGTDHFTSPRRTFPISTYETLNLSLGLTIMKFGKFLTYRPDREIYWIQDLLRKDASWPFAVPDEISFLFDHNKYNISEKTSLVYQMFTFAKETFQRESTRFQPQDPRHLQCRIHLLDSEILIGAATEELDRPREAQEQLKITIDRLENLLEPPRIGRKRKSPQSPTTSSHPITDHLSGHPRNRASRDAMPAKGSQLEAIHYLLANAHRRLARTLTDEPSRSIKFALMAIEEYNKANSLYNPFEDPDDDRDPGMTLTRRAEDVAEAYELLAERLLSMRAIPKSLSEDLELLGIPPPLSPRLKKFYFAKEALFQSITRLEVAFEKNVNEAQNHHRRGLAHLGVAKSAYHEYMYRKSLLTGTLQLVLNGDTMTERVKAIAKVRDDVISESLGSPRRDPSLEQSVYHTLITMATGPRPSGLVSPIRAYLKVASAVASTPSLQRLQRPDHNQQIELGTTISQVVGSMRRAMETGQRSEIAKLPHNPLLPLLYARIRDSFQIRGNTMIQAVRQTLYTLVSGRSRPDIEESYWQLRSAIDRLDPTNSLRTLQRQSIHHTLMSISHLDLAWQVDHEFLRPAYDKACLGDHINFKDLCYPVNSRYHHVTLGIPNLDQLDSKHLMEQFRQRRIVAGKNQPFLPHLGKGNTGWVRDKYGPLPLIQKEMSIDDAEFIDHLFPTLVKRFESDPVDREKGVALLRDLGKNLYKQVRTLVSNYETIQTLIADGSKYATALIEKLGHAHGDQGILRSDLEKITHRNQELKKELDKLDRKRLRLYTKHAYHVPRTASLLMRELSIDYPHQSDKQVALLPCDAAYVREAMRGTSIYHIPRRCKKPRPHRIKEQQPLQRSPAPRFSFQGRHRDVRIYTEPQDYTRRPIDSFFEVTQPTFKKNPRTGMIRYLLLFNRLISRRLVNQPHIIYSDQGPENIYDEMVPDQNSLKWADIHQDWVSFMETHGPGLPGKSHRSNWTNAQRDLLHERLHQISKTEIPGYDQSIEDIRENWPAIKVSKLTNLYGHSFKKKFYEIQDRLKPEQRRQWAREAERELAYYHPEIAKTMIEATRNELLTDRERKDWARLHSLYQDMIIVEPYARTYESIKVHRGPQTA